MVEVILNGERRSVPADLSIGQLLAHLSISADRVAVERNRALVPREAWEQVRVESGDELEIVHFVGGG